MKRSGIKTIGKQGRKNIEGNRKIAEMFMYQSIEYCEYPYPHDCDGMLTNAHRHKRNWYYSQPEKYYAYEQVAKLCTTSHNLIEHNVELSEEVFMQLRGDE